MKGRILVKKNSFGITRGFILPDGDVAKTGTRHEDIVMEYLNDHIDKWKLYQKQGGDLCDFMVITLGALKVGNNGPNPMVITYKERYNLPEDFYFYIEYYKKHGYRIDAI